MKDERNLFEQYGFEKNENGIWSRSLAFVDSNEYSSTIEIYKSYDGYHVTVSDYCMGRYSGRWFFSYKSLSRCMTGLGKKLPYLGFGKVEA